MSYNGRQLPWQPSTRDCSVSSIWMLSVGPPLILPRWRGFASSGGPLTLPIILGIGFISLLSLSMSVVIVLCVRLWRLLTVKVVITFICRLSVAFFIDRIFIVGLSLGWWCCWWEWAGDGSILDVPGVGGLERGVVPPLAGGEGGPPRPAGAPLADTPLGGPHWEAAPRGGPPRGSLPLPLAPTELGGGAPLPLSGGPPRPLDCES